MTSSKEQLVPVEQIDYANAIHTMRSVSADIALFAACVAVGEKHNPNWSGIKAKAEEWVFDLRTALRTPPAVEPDEGLVEKVAEVMAEDGGCWSACSGCQESVDGSVSTRDYPYSHIFKCQPGGGCHECGGIGVIWMDGKFLAGYGEALDPSIRAQALEEAAKVADNELCEIFEDSPEVDAICNAVVREIAANIRSLKEGSAK